MWVVLLVALVSAAASYFLALPFQGALETTSFAALAPILLAVAGFFSSFVIWLFYGLLVRIGAGMEAKTVGRWRGTRSRLSLCLNAVLLIVVIAFPIEVSPITVDVNDAQVSNEVNARVQREIGSSFAGRANQILSYLGTLWWIVLIFLGVRETAGQRGAVRATFVVGVVAVGFALGSFLFTPIS